MEYKTTKDVKLKAELIEKEENSYGFPVPHGDLLALTDFSGKLPCYCRQSEEILTYIIKEIHCF